MGIVGIANEMPGSPKATLTLNKYTFIREHLVQTDSYLTGPLEVVSAVGVPRAYQIYTFGPELHLFARCREVVPEWLAPNSLFWKITSTYETPDPWDSRENRQGSPFHETDGEQDNPLLQLPEITTAFETYQQPIFGIYDTSSGQYKPLKASNGQIYDPPPSRDQSSLTLTITRNEDVGSPHPLTGLIYQDAVNTQPFWGCGAGTAKICGITAQRLTKNLPNGSQFAYLRVTYVVHFRANPVTGTWDQAILDEGDYYYQSTLNPIKVAFLTIDGHPRKGLLDGAGHALADTGTPVYNTIRPYTRLDFTGLNLPQSFLQVS